MSNHYQLCTNIFFLNAVFFSNIHLSPALEKMLSLLLMDHEQPLMANEFADKN